MRLIDADILVQDTIQEYARSKQYRDAIIRMINKAPTIEPKRGEWNKPDYGMCSNCHRYAPETENGFYLSDFCPNCGADMREREGE